MKTNWRIAARKGATVVVVIIALCLGLVACSTDASDEPGRLDAELANAAPEEGVPEGSGTFPDAQAVERDSNSEGAESTSSDSSEGYPTADELLIIKEQAPIPDTWVVEEFSKMAERQRKLVVNAVDDETYQLLVKEYGEEEVARYRDDESN